MLMEDLEWLLCVCTWHPAFILSVLKCTVNKVKEVAPPLLPLALVCLSGPDVNFIHSAGSLNDITVFM